MFTVTKIKDYSVGKILPETHGGAAGRAVEEGFASSGELKLSNGPGVDIVGSNTEIKSRNVDSKSDHTIGSMTIKKIIATPYEDTNICKKLQNQIRVYTKTQQLWDKQINVVVGGEVVNFNQEYSQEQIKLSYEYARKLIIEGVRTYRIGYSKWGYFEYREKVSKTSVKFRIPNSGFKPLLSIAKTAKTFNTFFE